MPRRVLIRVLSIGLLCMLLFVGCAQLQAIAPPTPSPRPTLREASGGPDYWPTKGWRVSSPEQQGMDAERLKEVPRQIAAQGLGVDSYIVVRNGFIVAEQYYPPYGETTPHILYSVTKSVVSTLVGIARDEGRIGSLDTPVLDLFLDRTFDNVDADKRAMTLQNVLTMTSGLGWSEDYITGMYSTRDWLAGVLGLRMAGRPGSSFLYCSGCTHVLSDVVTRQSGVNTYDYARTKLFAPLGISDPQWERAPDGVPIGGWGLYLTPQDMAKLGYLYLNQGVWDGKQVVSAEWVKDATAKHVTSDDASGFGYGYQWWVDEKVGGYFARGRAGQLIFVVPEKQLVVVITANQMDDHPLLKLIEDYVVAAAK